jgi:hypothetical protein
MNASPPRGTVLEILYSITVSLGREIFFNEKTWLYFHGYCFIVNKSIVDKQKNFAGNGLFGDSPLWLTIT